MKLVFEKLVTENNLKLRNFLEYRFNLPNGKNGYRGLSLSQHNRWNFHKFDMLMETFAETNDEFLWIPPGDEKNYDHGDNRIKPFLNFCDLFKKKYGKGTPNSIKKNTFPDLSRMGVLERYSDKDGKLTFIEPLKNNSKTVSFVSLSESTDAYFDCSNRVEKNLIYEKFCRNIINPILEDLIYVAENLEGKLEINEFMLFFSFINCEYLGDIVDRNEIIDLIKSYRFLTISLKEHIISNLKSFLDPKKYKTLSKNLKKDFGNFKNETDQIFSIIKTGNLFVVDESDKGNSIIKLNYDLQEGKFIKKRSNTAKKEYWINHGIEQKDNVNNFELDHLIPFSLSNTYEELVKIDNWKNLILISPNKHAMKTRNRNKYMVLKTSSFSENNSIELASILDEEKLKLELGFENDFICNPNLLEEMENYNKMLIQIKNII